MQDKNISRGQLFDILIRRPLNTLQQAALEMQSPVDSGLNAPDDPVRELLSNLAENLSQEDMGIMADAIASADSLYLQQNPGQRSIFDAINNIPEGTNIFDDLYQSFGFKGDRRSFMGASINGAASATLLASGISSIGEGNEWSDSNGLPEGEEKSNGLHKKEMFVEESKGVYLSKVDKQTAKFVTAEFFGVVGGQLANIWEMNMATAAAMIGGWSWRMVRLWEDAHGNPDEKEREASHHAFQHEWSELINIGVAMGLVAASEFTSKVSLKSVVEAELEEKKNWLAQLVGEEEIVIEHANGHGPVTITLEDFLERFHYEDPKDVMELLDLPEDELRDILEKRIEQEIIDLRREKEFDEIEETLTSDEDLDAKIIELEQQLTGELVKEAVVGGVVAPFLLTFTSASILNKSARERLILRITELEYLREKRKVDPKLFLDKDEVWEKAKKNTKGLINGPLGLANLLLATGANLNGALLWGDPPNVFYIAKFGWKEWGQNQGKAALTVLGLNALNYSVFLFRLGIGSDILKAVPGMLKSGLSKHYQDLMRNQIDQIAIAFKKTGKLDVDWASLREDLPAKLGEIIFATDLLQMFGVKFPSSHDKDGKNHEDIEGFKEKVYDKYSEWRAEGFFDNLIDRFPDEFAKQEEDKKAYAEKLKVDIHDLMGQDLEVEEMAEVLFNKHFGHIDTLLFSNEQIKETVKDQTKKNLRELIAQEMSAAGTHGSHDHHARHFLSHAPRDVRNALFTQLWAVGSLQTFFKEFLGLENMQSLTPKEAKAEINKVMWIIAGASSVADNVAAMLFGIDVIQTIGKIAVGEETYENDYELQHALRSDAFLVAVIGGSLSKIGNGANMSIEKLKEIVRVDYLDFLMAIMDKNKLLPSFANLYAWMNVLAVIEGLGRWDLNRVFKKYEDAAAAAH